MDNLKENEALGTEGSKPSSESHLLIALRGRLFVMDGLRSVFESKRGFDACGTGLEVALGYLMATPDMEPYERALGALRASAELILAVGPPFHIEKL